MKKKPDQTQSPEPSTTAGSSRRQFLGAVSTLGLVGAAALLKKSGPRELSLREADFYKPHTLAG